MKFRFAPAATVLAALAVAGCSSEGELVIEQGVGITAVRSACPAVGVPYFTGDMTLFDPASARTADALDVTATITNVRSTCNEQAGEVATTASFDVLATRYDTAGARSVELPYFSTVMRGGTNVVAKRVGTVRIDFADGEARAIGSGMAGAVVDRAAATLSDDIRDRITRRRSPGDAAAGVDPLTEPDVREAVARATFELLIGFQLDDDQLAYNATR